MSNSLEAWSDQKFASKLLKLHASHKDKNGVKPLGQGTEGTVYPVHGPHGEPMAGKVFKVSVEGILNDLYISKLLASRPEYRLVHSNVFLPQDRKEPVVTRMDRYVPLMTWLTQQREQWSSNKEEQSKRNVEQKILVVCRDMACGLANLHAAHWAHFDVKPDNTFVKSDRAHIGDFGLASSKYGTTPHPELVTIGYRAPELYSTSARLRKQWTEKADIWSLGIVFLDILVAFFFPGSLSSRSGYFVGQLVPLRTSAEVSRFVGVSGFPSAEKVWESLTDAWYIKQRQLKYPPETMDELVLIMNGFAKVPSKLPVILCSAVQKMLLPNPEERWSAVQVMNFLDSCLTESSDFKDVPMDCVVRESLPVLPWSEEVAKRSRFEPYVRESSRHKPSRADSILETLGVMQRARQAYPDVPPRHLEQILLGMRSHQIFDDIPMESYTKFLNKPSNVLWSHDAKTRTPKQDKDTGQVRGKRARSPSKNNNTQSTIKSRLLSFFS